ncbi:MAG: hypothetical protein ACI9MC_000948 [Kiritimatiellia bacterium]|jgi:hypothetical protein
MRASWLLSVLAVYTPLIACRPHPTRVPAPATDVSQPDEFQAFRKAWLAPAYVVRPTIEFTALRSDTPGLEAFATPVMPEDARWNRWPDGSRLFNNRAAWLFEVHIEGDHRLRWMPAGTKLELNEPGDGLSPSRLPDDLIRPLLVAALEEERSFVDGDLVQRTRAAGPFRSAYMPLSEQHGTLRGLVAFPTGGAWKHVTGLRLSVTLAVDDRPTSISWTFD